MYLLKDFPEIHRKCIFSENLWVKGFTFLYSCVEKSIDKEGFWCLMLLDIGHKRESGVKSVYQKAHQVEERVFLWGGSWWKVS